MATERKVFEAVAEKAFKQLADNFLIIHDNLTVRIFLSRVGYTGDQNTHGYVVVMLLIYRLANLRRPFPEASQTRSMMAARRIPLCQLKSKPLLMPCAIRKVQNCK
jgi:hypothetical protein